MRFSERNGQVESPPPVFGIGGLTSPHLPALTPALPKAVARTHRGFACGRPGMFAQSEMGFQGTGLQPRPDCPLRASICTACPVTSYHATWAVRVNSN